MTTTQIPLFDLADFRETNPEHRVQQITCPACGYTAQGVMWSFRMYHGWSDRGEPCISMDLSRSHVLYALKAGREAIDARSRKGESEFDAYIRGAIAIWGERAHDFIPDEHWPSQD